MNYVDKVDQIVLEIEQMHERVRYEPTGDGNGHPALDKYIISKLKTELANTLETLDNAFEILKRQ